MGRSYGVAIYTLPEGERLGGVDSARDLFSLLREHGIRSSEVAGLKTAPETLEAVE